MQRWIRSIAITRIWRGTRSRKWTRFTR